MRQHLLGHTKAYEVEYRIQKKDGSYVWYYDRGPVMKRSSKGDPLIVAGIVFDISQQKKIEEKLHQANEKLRYLSQTDDLTSAYNKRYMTKKITGEMKALTKEKSSLSLMMIDIDNFKEVNDQFGHLMGDNLLQYLTAGLKNK